MPQGLFLFGLAFRGTALDHRRARWIGMLDQGVEVQPTFADVHGHCALAFQPSSPLSASVLKESFIQP